MRYWNPKTMDPKVDKSTINIIDYGPVWEAMAQGLIEGEKESLRGVARAEGYETFITYHSSQCELYLRLRSDVSRAPLVVWHQG